MKLGIIFGDCLFPKHTLEADYYFVAEDKDLCTHFKYHKHKIILFLSAMRSHAKTLDNCLYYKLNEQSYEEKLRDAITQKGVTELVCYEINDKFMKERLESFAKQEQLTLTLIPTQGFLTSIEDFSNWRKDRKPQMQFFYQWQRTRLNILLDQDGKPVGGKWSFDQENRKPLPKHIALAEIPRYDWTEETKEVMQLVDEHFADHPGDSQDFWLPTTRKQAEDWMEEFFKNRFDLFGDYEDAIHQDEAFLFHSLLSPLLNCGLLTPREVVDKALSCDVPINSKEGFIRQVIGWREFIRGMYWTEDFSGNYFNHQRKLSKDWYEGTTTIEPVDTVIQRVQKYGFAHHIERLMILGNVMLMSELHPDEVYKWFMELFVDSADWVMVPNVYGMSQFADGGSFATKPYVGASNYMRKMSNFKKGEWCDVVDGLFWRFLDKQRSTFEQNPRMRMLLGNLEKRDYSAKIKLAEKFIATHTTQ